MNSSNVAQSRERNQQNICFAAVTQMHVVQVRKRSFLFLSKKPTDSGNMFKYIFPLVFIVSLVLNFLSSGIKKILKSQI